MWNTWNIHSLMTTPKVFNADTKYINTPLHPSYSNKDTYLFGDEEISRDTKALCKTVHRLQGFHTQSIRANPVAMKDFILIDAKATDSSGMSSNKQSKNIAGPHKIRYNIDWQEKDGDWVTEHQGEVHFPMEDGWWKQGGIHLITKAGKWRVQMDSISSGTCALPTGVHTVGTFTAKEPKELPCEEQNREPVVGITNKTGCLDCIEGYEENEWGECVEAQAQDEDYEPPTDLNNLLMVGGGLLALALVLKKKRKKKE